MGYAGILEWYLIKNKGIDFPVLQVFNQSRK